MTARQWLAAFASGLALLAAVPASAGAQYFYDSAGRLIKVAYSNGVTIEYKYDPAGNRTEIVTSQPANTPPNAVNDAASVNASGVVDIYVRANDSDVNGNTLTVTAVTTPTGGTAVIQSSGTFIRYTAPSTGGVYTFNYTVSDGAGGTATATVTVTVAAAVANTPPVAVDDTADTPISTSMAIMVLSNDTDVDANTLTVTGVTTPTGGTVSIASGGGYVIYTGPATWGTYTFNYTVSDGAGGTDVGQVMIDVTPGEDPGGGCGRFEEC